MNDKCDDTITELINVIAKFCDERGWGKIHNPKDIAISLSLEASELLEVFQWSGADTGISGKEDKVREELADVIIYALLMADTTGMDVARIVKEKIALNAKKYPVDSGDVNIAKDKE